MLRTTFGRALVLGFIGAMVSIGIVAATPGSGAVGSILSIGILPAGVKVDTYDLKLKTRDDVQVVTQTITIAPGGHTGWHSHPGPVFVTITARDDDVLRRRRPDLLPRDVCDRRHVRRSRRRPRPHRPQ